MWHHIIINSESTCFTGDTLVAAEDIDTTTNHPFYVIGSGWVAAGDLNEGDEVYLIDGSIAFITGAELEKLAEPIKVYNLEVADFNTYFVGDEAVLVHNYPDNGDGSKPRGSRNENTKSAASYGREMHKTYDYGGTYTREVPLGNAGRADAVDFDNHIVYELKPDNEQAIRKGWKQLDRYVAELERRYGGSWIKILVTYIRGE